MPRALALLIEYDGSDYAGWQRQPNGISIQELLEQAVATVFGASAPVIGSGRTDAGVHARGQVAHVHLPVDAHDIPLDKVHIALNTKLPYDVRIRAAREVSPGFHARYQPMWREYVYIIVKEYSVFTRHHAWHPELPYQVSPLSQATAAFEGRWDFTTFSKHNPDTDSYVCDLQICRVEELNDRIMIRLRADRFVYGMCRAIVGAAMSVGRGRTTLDELRSALEAGDRNLAPGLAPAHGLILNRVCYADGLFDEYTCF